MEFCIVLLYNGLMNILIEDKLPASLLLGEDNQTISETNFYGDQAITLTKDAYIRFSLTPNSDVIIKPLILP